MATSTRTPAAAGIKPRAPRTTPPTTQHHPQAAPLPPVAMAARNSSAAVHLPGAAGSVQVVVAAVGNPAKQAPEAPRVVAAEAAGGVAGRAHTRVNFDPAASANSFSN